MKSKIIITCILVGFIITLFAIFNFKCPYSFKENVLYTQNDVSGYNENEKENNNLVNRNEAIKTARYYIEDILGNDLESANNKMYVNLYKNDSGAESYYWNISWSSPTLSCGIEINTINKEINDIYVNKDLDKVDNNQKSSLPLKKEEILQIVDKLVKALGFNLNLYDLNVSKGNYYNYEICTFTNKKDDKDKFMIYIDNNGKFITRYKRNPHKEIY